MGTDGLLKLCKEGCVEVHDLSFGRGGMIYVDGGNLLHRSLSRRGVAVDLIKGNVVPLAKAAVGFLQLFMGAGWQVMVIFDGATPPAKGDTSGSRARSRESNLAKLHTALTPGEREKFARKAVGFNPEVVARVSRLLTTMIGVESLVSPYEADAQLVHMERTFRHQFSRCFIFGNDSDLVVLGARNLLYQIRHDRMRGTLSGDSISRAALMNPHPSTLFDAQRGKFLRSLHGPAPASGRVELKNETIVNSRLVNFAAVDGNDYFRTRGVGPAGSAAISFCTAMDTLELDGAGHFVVVAELARRVAAKVSGTTYEDAMAGICVARWMFLHQAVFDPHSGQQRRLSGMREDTEEACGARESTGALVMDGPTAIGLATGSINPRTGAPWQPPLPDDSLRVRVRRHRIPGESLAPLGHPAPAPAPAPRDLLHESEDLSTLTVAQLKALLNGVRGLERSGVSGERKARLIALAENVRDVLRNLQTTDERDLFREPVRRGVTHEQVARAVFPGLPEESAWVTDFEQLRDCLPELGEAVIVAHLSSGEDEEATMSRNLYRGLQRVMDLGCLDGLSGVPSPSTGGTLWLRLTTRASMRDARYTVLAKILVQRVETEDGCDATESSAVGGGADGHMTSTGLHFRLVATKILSALCECMSGASGTCHHVAMILQLIRLLKMSAAEISEFDPLTVTGTKCKWILDHCKGGREAGFNVWWGKTLPEVTAIYRDLRDPKSQGLALEAGTEVTSQGVVSGDRFASFDPHPSGGRWVESHRNFRDEGYITEQEEVAFGEFFAAVKNAKDKGRRSGEGEGGGKLGVDILPAKVRGRVPAA